MVKKKICAGFDGIEHEAFIYKNINGNKYCKICAYKLQPPKAINKISKKQVFKISLKRKLYDEDKKFYIDVWYQRFGRVEGTAEKYGNEIDNCTTFPKCEACGKRLFFDPTSVNFHHILEKRNYPDLRHVEWNIAIVCPDCHSSYETLPDSVPYLKLKRDETLFRHMLLESREFFETENQEYVKQ